MGLLDFLKKGEEKPAPESKKPEAKPITTNKVPDAPQVSNTKPLEQSYTVQKGDTLSKIAKQYYGNANQWNIIFQANKNIISNPDLIKPGQILKIPQQ